jgi:hypothetical protein
MKRWVKCNRTTQRRHTNIPTSEKTLLNASGKALYIGQTKVETLTSEWVNSVCSIPDKYSSRAGSFANV